METELRDSQQAQRHLLQSWGLSRAGKLSAACLTATLRVALEVANEGQAIASLGFISDLVLTLTGEQDFKSTDTPEVWQAGTLDASLLRRYEDYVLGKFAADMSLERAYDELQKYKDSERDRALAFAVQQVQLRANLPCVLIGPASIKGLLQLSGSALQKLFYEFQSEVTSALVIQQCDDLIQSVRNCGELFGPEDIFELACGTALSKFGQRLALRQVMQASQYLVVGLPKQKIGGQRRHNAVATNILEEDLYPVGGFSSIANRGTMESLLRSELAYMEDGQRPDIFDIKYARDELLYYSRDENQFFRRRYTLVFVLDASLAIARVKEPGAAWQRIVLILATVATMVQTLSDWLASEALHFDIAFLSEVPKDELREERDVLEMLFREEIRTGRLVISQVNQAQLRSRCIEYARRSQCQCVHVHARRSNGIEDWLEGDQKSVPESVWKPLLSELDIRQPLPRVAYDEQLFTFEESAEPWRDALRKLLEAVD